jgi:hypothetical protein
MAGSKQFVTMPVQGTQIVCVECAAIVYTFLGTVNVALMATELAKAVELHSCSRITPANALPGKPRLI